MKLLVTGGAGYIGGTVAHQLADAGHEVIVLDDLSTGYAENVPESARLIQIPIHRADDVLTPGSGFDAVLHFAAEIEVAESVADPDRFWRTNIEGSLALMRAMRRAGVRRLIFSSTGSMYTGRAPFTEDSPVQPRNPYAATKWTVDQMIQAACHAYGLGAASLRYFNAAGAVRHHGDRWLGERHDPETHLIPILLQCAGGQRDSFTLYGDDYPTDDGTCIRDYIHVSDLAAAHLLALGDLEAGRYDVFNLGNGAGYSNREVLDMVREVTGRAFPVTVAARRPGDPAISVAASTKAAAVLGWKPQRPDLCDIVADAWEFHRRTMTI